MFRQGEPSRWVALLDEGYVKVVRFTGDGAEVVLNVRGPGSLLGEQAAIDRQARPVTVIALDEVEVFVVDAAPFRAYLEEHPRVAADVARLLSLRLRESDRVRATFGTRTTLQRVADRLVDLSERFGREEGGELRITVPLEQRDLASWVGSSRESVNRALGRLRRRGLVETGRRRILVRDLDGLRSLT